MVKSRNITVTGIEKTVLDRIKSLGIIPKCVVLSHSVAGDSLHLISFESDDKDYNKVLSTRFGGKRIFNKRSIVKN